MWPPVTESISSLSLSLEAALQTLEVWSPEMLQQPPAGPSLGIVLDASVPIGSSWLRDGDGKGIGLGRRESGMGNPGAAPVSLVW